MRQENILIVIPAKWGSRRLPAKNYKYLNGYPVICYVLDSALEFGKGDIIISTENMKEMHEVLYFCSLYNDVAVIDRPKELAEDPANIDDVVLHVLQFIKKRYDTLIILQADCPLTTSDDIETAYLLFSRNREAVRSVTHTDNPFFTMRMNDGPLKPFSTMYQGISEFNRDFGGQFYRSNGAIFIIDMKEYIEKRTRLVDPLLGYVMPKERSFDIDDFVDFKIVEALLNERR